MNVPEPCKSCQAQCCKVGYIIKVYPNEEIYKDDAYVHKSMEPGTTEPFHNMKSNGDGYTCIALGKNNECTIWDKRPQMCRDLEANGAQCLALRKHFNRP